MPVALAKVASWGEFTLSASSAGNWSSSGVSKSLSLLCGSGITLPVYSVGVYVVSVAECADADSVSS